MNEAAILEHWERVSNDPKYSQIDDKFETTEQGKIILTPHNFPHSRYQGRIIKIFNQFSEGEASPECPVLTSAGVKMVDVVWMSPADVAASSSQTVANHCPSICVEVWSPSNTKKEFDLKTELYFAAGAKEVWICKEGNFTFTTRNGQQEGSDIFPGFPKQILL